MKRFARERVVEDYKRATGVVVKAEAPGERRRHLQQLLGVVQVQPAGHDALVREVGDALSDNIDVVCEGSDRAVRRRAAEVVR